MDCVCHGRLKKIVGVIRFHGFCGFRGPWGRGVDFGDLMGSRI